MSNTKKIVLDATQISAYLTCPEQWNLAYHENLRLADANRDPLLKGSAMHKILELYYLARLEGISLFDSASKAMEKFTQTEECLALMEASIDIKQIVARFRDYAIHYQADDFQPIKKDNIPSVELGFSKFFGSYEDTDFILEGKIDLLSLIGQNELIFVDHKTQSRANNLYPFSPQFLTYAMVTNIDKMVINYIRFQKEVSNNTFIRQLVTFPKHRIERWHDKVYEVFIKIKAGLELKQGSAEGKIKLWQNDKSCGGAFGSNPCQFTHICDLDPNNFLMLENLKNFKYKCEAWEPWLLKIED